MSTQLTQKSTQTSLTRLATVLPLLQDSAQYEPLLPDLYALQIFQVHQVLWHPSLPEKFEQLKIALIQFHCADETCIEDEEQAEVTVDVKDLHWASQLITLRHMIHICGARGTGKTILAYILLLDIMRQRPESRVVWIHTQASIFDVDRIAKMASSEQLDRVDIKCAFNLVELNRILTPLLSSAEPVIVVVDSLSLLVGSSTSMPSTQSSNGEDKQEFIREMLGKLDTLARLAPLIYVTTAVITDTSPSRFASNKYGLPWAPESHSIPDNILMLSSGKSLFGDKEAFVVDKEIKGGKLKTGIIEVIKSRENGTRGIWKAFATGDHDLFLLE